MISRMAGLLSIMAFMVLTITWCIRVEMGLPAMKPSTLLYVGCGVLFFYYFVLGKIMAWLGIRLVQERIAEKRAQEEEILHQARLREQQIRQQREEEERKEKSQQQGAQPAPGAAAAGAAPDASPEAPNA